MGELIVLAQRLADRSRPSRQSPTAFFFDLACPFSYLAAERVERLLGEVQWIPVSPLATVASGGPADPGATGSAAARAAAERQALDLRLPLVWPEPPSLSFPSATRAAAYAAHAGRAARFALAAGRLAFCGGFDLEDLQILADAAAAAGLSPEECVAAAANPAWDEQPRATAAGLVRRGVRELPAVRIGHHWRYGQLAMAEAAALIRARAAGLQALDRHPA